MQQSGMQSIAVGSPSPTLRDTLSAYHELTKPGITMMVVITAAAGFYLALPRNAFVYLTFEYAARFLATLAGTALVSAGSCALNHVMERRYDEQMKRTMNRPIPSGRVRSEHAVVFGMALTVAGLALLGSLNMLAASLAALTWVMYIGVYTPLKRRTQLSTLIGGIPGALPPLGGWVMGGGRIEAGGILLFVILFLWQMPHFLSLAWMYRKDYERGGFPMLTVLDESGMVVARHVVSYTVLLVLFSASLTTFGVTGMVYFAGSLALGAGFIAMGLRFFFDRSSAKARAVLLSSYVYLLAVLALMFIDKA
jgi:heme o synthase